MKTDRLNLPDNLRTHLAGMGYRQFQEEYPDFGGIILYARKGGGELEAAYYISKPSSIELVTSDELRLVLDFLEESGIPLRHVVTSSPVSAGSRKLAEENGIGLWELQTRYVEIAQPISDHTRRKRQTFRLGWPFATGTGRPR